MCVHLVEPTRREVKHVPWSLVQGETQHAILVGWWSKHPCLPSLGKVVSLWKLGKPIDDALHVLMA